MMRLVLVMEDVVVLVLEDFVFLVLGGVFLVSWGALLLEDVLLLACLLWGVQIY